MAKFSCSLERKETNDVATITATGSTEWIWKVSSSALQLIRELETDFGLDDENKDQLRKEIPEALDAIQCRGQYRGKILTVSLTPGA